MDVQFFYQNPESSMVHRVRSPSADNLFTETFCNIRLGRRDGVHTNPETAVTCMECTVAVARAAAIPSPWEHNPTVNPTCPWSPPECPVCTCGKVSFATKRVVGRSETPPLRSSSPLQVEQPTPPSDRANDLVVNVKESNPKDAIGARKVPFATVSAPVMAEIGLAMLEGACKYGRHNYRVIGVRSSVYYDAALRHLTSWWEGEDIDPASGLSHLTKALSSLMVLRDAQINDKVADDRPPPTPQGWVEKYNKDAERIIDGAPRHLPPYTRASI